MKKIFMSSLLAATLSCGMGNAGTYNDNIFVNRMLLSNSENRVILNSISPGKNIEIFTNKDDIILYYADIGVINPTKKKYDIEIICVDKDDNAIIKGAFKREFILESERHIGANIMKKTLLIVTLDPKVGAMAPGQLTVLKAHNNYFIKLYIEKKLIGVTNFSYEIDK